MNYFELSMFITYFLFVLGVGIWFFVKDKNTNEKDYFLGGKSMNGWVSALSAGASDMSNWILMGLPGSICMLGLGQVWISVGLLIGTILSWVLVAPNLRRYSLKAKDSITMPEFFANRFLEKGSVLRVSCAVIFVVGYCIYAASSIVACGKVLNFMVPKLDNNICMIISAVIIVAYTLLGGFKAVCWTDFFQGLLMLFALLSLPIVALLVLDKNPVALDPANSANYFNFLTNIKM